MDDSLDGNLSYILNEHTIEEKNELKKQKEKSNGKYFLYSVLLIVLVYVSIIFFKEIKTFSNNLINTYITKDEKKEPIIYKNKEKIEKKESLLGNTKTNQKKEIKVVEKIVEKIVKAEPTREDLINMFNTDNFNTYKCTNYRIHKFQLSSTCENELEQFLNENKDAFRFEVVPTLGQNDVKSYLKYKAYLEEVLMAGISMKRANEMVWAIKQQLPENNIITVKDYYIKSEDAVSSVMVKAYH